MGWEDRSYYRERGGVHQNPLFFLLFGSLPVFTSFGIRVRVHMTLILFAAFEIIFDAARYGGAGAQMATEAMVILFGIVLLHEYGHCFASRWVGGHPDQIILTPLGGAAFVDAPKRPGPTLFAVAGGPLVNVLICVLAQALMYVMRSHWVVNPTSVGGIRAIEGWLNIYGYLFWIYTISLALLLFNLLPIFPFDGGQMLQALLWFRFGYYKSMMFACITGIVGGAILALVGLAGGNFWLVIIGGMGIIDCVQIRRITQEAGPEVDYVGDMMDYSASLHADAPKKRKRVSSWKVRRLRREAARDAAEQQMIDTILAKVSAHGMHTLTWVERRALKRATERQRKRDLELSRRD